MRKLDFFNEESSFQSGPLQAKYRATQCVINVSIIYFLFVAPPHHQKCGQSQGETLMSSLFRPYMCLYPCININKISFIELGKIVLITSCSCVLFCPLKTTLWKMRRMITWTKVTFWCLLQTSATPQREMPAQKPEARSQKRHR